MLFSVVFGNIFRFLIYLFLLDWIRKERENNHRLNSFLEKKKFLSFSSLLKYKLNINLLFGQNLEPLCETLTYLPGAIHVRAETVNKHAILRRAPTL